MKTEMSMMTGNGTSAKRLTAVNESRRDESLKGVISYLRRYGRKGSFLTI